MRGRNGSKQIGVKEKEPEFEFDTVALSFIKDIEKLSPERVSFNLDSYKTEALKIFTIGITPIVEYYLRANFGPDLQKELGSITRPWSAMDLAQIFRTQFPAFIDYGVRAPIRAFGSTLHQSLEKVDYNIGTDWLIDSFKIVQLCLEGFRMFPKERPRFTPYIPRVDFDELIRLLNRKRKELKKCWRCCTELINSYIDRPNRDGNGWGTTQSGGSKPWSVNSRPSQSTTNNNHPKSKQLILGLGNAIDDSSMIDKESTRVVERFEVSTNIDREKFLNDLENRMVHEYIDDQEDSQINQVPLPPPGSDGWFH
eukprot:g367.t1